MNKEKKLIKKSIKIAENEIKEWRKFLKLCKEKLKEKLKEK